jgi:hypothetical protein
LTGYNDTEGDVCFGQAQGGAFGPAEVGAGLDDLGGKGFGEAALAQMPVAVHRLEVELGRVDHEVVVQDVRVRRGFRESAALVERDYSRPAAPDPCPGLGFPDGSWMATRRCRAASTAQRPLTLNRAAADDK